MSAFHFIYFLYTYGIALLKSANSQVGTTMFIKKLGIKIAKSKDKNKTETKNPRAFNLDAISKNLTKSYENAFSSFSFDPKLADAYNHLVKSFFVLGPTKGKNDEPSLLFAYPSYKFPIEKISLIQKYCFPLGANVPFKDKDEDLINQFVFSWMEGSKDLLFGICSHIKLTPEESSFLTDYDKPGVYCICTMTTMPMLAVHFNYHEFLIDILKQKVSKFEGYSTILISDDVLTNEFLNYKTETFEKYRKFPMLKFDDDPLFVMYNSKEFPVLLRKALNFYLRIKVDNDNPGLYTLTNDCSLYVSKLNEARIEIARHCFDVLFSCLNEENVVLYYRAIILGQKILVVSKDIRKISFCVLAALPLILPMTYKFQIQPLIPDDEHIMGFLESPTPFIFGAVITPILLHQVLEDIIVVKLDENKIDFPINLNLPHLPDGKELRDDLKNMIHNWKATPPKESDTVKANAFWNDRISNLMPVRLKRQMKLKYSFTPIDSECILEKFQNFTNKFVERKRIEKCRVRDLSNENEIAYAFLKEVYLLDVPDNELDFYNGIIETQTFACYYQEIFNQNVK